MTVLGYQALDLTLHNALTTRSVPVPSSGAHGQPSTSRRGPPSFLQATGGTNPSSNSTRAPAKGNSSVGSLFTDLGHDFASLPSSKNLVALGIGGALALAVRPVEHDLTARASKSDPLEDLFEFGSAGGGGWVQVGGALGTYALGLGTGHGQIQILGADLLRAQIVNTALTQSIKIAVQRTRPDQGRFSFPSRHTSATFATATVLQRHFGWRVSIPAAASKR